ncbi:hypothetical protein [Glaciimonas sp. Gout2]|uniref:hypothetical protein n=1 Tax=Glaciimonas sp. Gout2 TaxID=3048625 RepID=UPI002B238A39|nr:hypothetical protein [Glaciimonas sp. Gout2]
MSSKADVPHYDEVAQAIKVTVDRFVSLDILVNNAVPKVCCPSVQMSASRYGWQGLANKARVQCPS